MLRYFTVGNVSEIKAFVCDFTIAILLGSFGYLIKPKRQFIYFFLLTVFYTFLCSVDCNKTSIKLQEGETMSYKWVSEKDFIKFVNSAEIINLQKQRYLNYFIENGFLIK